MCCNKKKSQTNDSTRCAGGWWARRKVAKEASQLTTVQQPTYIDKHQPAFTKQAPYSDMKLPIEVSSHEFHKRPVYGLAGVHAVLDDESRTEGMPPRYSFVLENK